MAYISTEGPIGWAGRRYCLKHGFPYTSTYHTRFPEYVRLRAPIPLALSYAFVRRFHGSAVYTMVATSSMKRALESRGFKNLEYWSRGVDIDDFKPAEESVIKANPPIFLYLGRVAVEKNIRDFLQLDLPGTKVVIGDGPDRERLQAEYPNCKFPGYKFGRDLARHLAGADVFVFPSKTDTFGIVMLEAMACGLPVAAYPVTGPIDVVRDGETGVLHDDLKQACLAALKLNGRKARRYAEQRCWRRSTDQFVAHLAPPPGCQLDGLEQVTP